MMFETIDGDPGFGIFSFYFWIIQSLFGSFHRNELKVTDFQVAYIKKTGFKGYITHRPISVIGQFRSSANLMSATFKVPYIYES